MKHLRLPVENEDVRVEGRLKMLNLYCQWGCGGRKYRIQGRGGAENIYKVAARIRLRIWDGSITDFPPRYLD